MVQNGIGGSLKSEIVGSCSKCKDGFLEDITPCECMIKFRSFNRMISGGFSKSTLDFISSGYEYPFIELGEDSIKKFEGDFVRAEKMGLGLYLYSKERGRGKTTIAHHLVYQASKFFQSCDLYQTRRTYAFDNSDTFLTSMKNETSSPRYTATWYVLDDMGNEDSNVKWKKDLMISGLQRVLHYRRDNRLPTIFTSNYTPEDIGNRYDGVLNSLMEISPDGGIGGKLYREVRVGGGEDLRMTSTDWED